MPPLDVAQIVIVSGTGKLGLQHVHDLIPRGLHDFGRLDAVSGDTVGRCGKAFAAVEGTALSAVYTEGIA
jgi:hypothetical protein